MICIIFTQKKKKTNSPALSVTLMNAKMGKDFLAVAIRLYDLRQIGYIEEEEVSTDNFPLYLIVYLIRLQNAVDDNISC